MSTTFFINTADFDAVSFALFDSAVSVSAKTIKHARIVIKRNDSDKILSYLKKFLEKPKKFDTNLIKKILIVTGEGSFTGIRTGASIALALGFVWRVPVYAIQKKDLPKDGKAAGINFKKARKVTASFDPAYGAPAKITKPRRK